MDYFLRGLKAATHYYSKYGNLKVEPLLKYEGVLLSYWINAVKSSILTGNISDEDITILSVSGLDLGIKPLKQRDWYKIAEKWFEENPIETFSSAVMYKEYHLGKWIIKNRKQFPRLLKYEKAVRDEEKRLTLEKRIDSKDREKKLGLLLHVAQKRDIKLSVSELRELSQWVRSRINEKDRRSLYEISKLFNENTDWIEKGPGHSDDQSSFMCIKLMKRCNKLFQEVIDKQSLTELVEQKLENVDNAILSIKVIGRSIDYYKDDVINASKACDYYEVWLDLTTLFTPEQFVGFVKNNGKILIEYARKAVIDHIYKKEGKVVDKDKIVKNKATYGVVTHSVSVMFMRLP